MMRAKMRVSKVTPYGDPSVRETVEFHAITEGQFGPNGESEDNTYAKYTPAGTLSLTIANPALLGKLQVDQKYYLDFTLAPEDA